MAGEGGGGGVKSLTFEKTPQPEHSIKTNRIAECLQNKSRPSLVVLSERARLHLENSAFFF